MDNKIAIGLIVVMFFVGVFVGHVYKHCPECQECVYTQPNKVVERMDEAVKEVKKEIKKETYEEVKKIYHADVPELDSIWHDFAKRYGKDSH